MAHSIETLHPDLLTYGPADDATLPTELWADPVSAWHWRAGYNAGHGERAAADKIYDEGYEVGRIDGIDEGRIDGYDDGRIDGIDEGRDEGIAETYAALLIVLTHEGPDALADAVRTGAWETAR